jgi:hypothetical protein
MSPHVSRLQTHLPMQKGSGVAMCGQARRPVGKGSGVVMCPTAPNPPPSEGGLWCLYVPHVTGPATQQGRAPVSPRVLRLQTHLPVREGSSVITCPVALSL